MTNEIIQYTEEQVKSMTNQELVNEILKYDVKFTHLSRYLKKNEQILWNEILYRSSFLKSFEPLQARIYCLLNNINSYPLCRNDNCNNTTRWKGKGFLKFCCRKCQYESEEFKRSIRNTNIERYGVPYVLLSKDIQSKIKQTCMERYGVDNPIKSKEIQNRIKNTCIELYGVEHALQSSVIRERGIKTNIERYGNACSLRNNDVQQKSRNTILSKYGVEFVFQSDVIKNKIKKTNIERYGTEYAASSNIVRMKIKNTCIARYGVDCSLNSISAIIKKM